jgi:hypothetical protein
MPISIPPNSPPPNFDPTVDYNHDGKVNEADVAAFLEAMHQQELDRHRPHPIPEIEGGTKTVSV